MGQTAHVLEAHLFTSVFWGTPALPWRHGKAVCVQGIGKPRWYGPGMGVFHSTAEPGLLAGLCGAWGMEGRQMPLFRVPTADVGREKAGVGSSRLKGVVPCTICVGGGFLCWQMTHSTRQRQVSTCVCFGPGLVCSRVSHLHLAFLCSFQPLPSMLQVINVRPRSSLMSLSLTS